jgi:hypothetical protein
MKINPVNATDRSAWTKSSFTDGKQISTAISPIDWVVKALFDEMLAKEKQTIATKKLGAYERRKDYGV